ncbi:hypothetical protein Q5752_003906 [Cryptotrichosporon argae]
MNRKRPAQQPDLPPTPAYGLPARPPLHFGASPAPAPALPGYAYPAPVPYFAPPFAAPYNLSGGYNGYYQPSYGYPALPVVPVPSYRPAATPEGYSYSPTYAEGSQKRQRTGGGAQGRGAHAVGLTSAVAPQGAAAVKPWRNCSHAGCRFVGSGDEVEIHEMDRHLIFPAGYKAERSEEEERFARSSGQRPAIQGTNVTLNTDEDIAKWVAERKARWPSTKRIADKAAEEQAARERGEIPSRGRGRGRGRVDAARAAEDWGRPSELESHRPSAADGAEATPVAPVEAVPAKVALGMVDYSSSEMSDTSSSDTDSDSSSESESGSDANAHHDADAAAAPVQASTTDQTDKPECPLCHAFARTGRCRNGERCRYAHVRKPAQDAQDARALGPDRPRAPREPPAKRRNPFERPSMLGALLANPIQNTLSQLSQTIRFLVANDFLRGVEAAPGEADEERRKRDMIIELPEVGGVVGPAHAAADATVEDVTKTTLTAADAADAEGGPVHAAA